MKEIHPEELFSKEILNFQVDTNKLGRVRYVNLDNAATTSPFLSVEDAVDDYFITYGSVHRGAGAKSKISTDVYEETRNTIKKFINAPEDSYVVYTGNTTGGMNMAAYFFSFLEGKIAVSAIEHSASWLPWIKAEGIKQLGEELVTLPEMDSVNIKIQQQGRKQVLQYDVNENFEFSVQDIEEMFKKDNIKAFVLTASSNATGYQPDIKKIGEIVHRYGAYFIVDACQYLQHHKLDMQDLGIDFLIASGHKFYAPYGGGFLIGPKEFLDQFLPYQIGGGNLPYITKEGEFLRYRNQLAHDPGTPNAVGAVSMAAALNKLDEVGLEQVEEYEKNLSKRLYDYLKTNPKVELYVSEKHLSTVVPFNIRGQKSLDVAEALNEDFGVGVRAGSFCVYHVARKLLDIEDEEHIIESVKGGCTTEIPGFVRASFGLSNTEEDVDRLIGAIEDITE